MRALHLPSSTSPVGGSNTPLYTYRANPPPASALQYTAKFYPTPTITSAFSSSRLPAEPIYLIRPLFTALTRSELTWEETLLPSRFPSDSPTGAIPGHDLVGIIDSVLQSHMSSVNSPPRFQPGQKVWALLGFARDGAAADRTFALESELSLMPQPPPTLAGASAAYGVNDRRDTEWEASLATLPLSGLSAWQALFEYGLGHVSKPGESRTTVLVTGAAGAVGCVAVQVAKAVGCRVISVCSDHNVRFVKEELGSDVVIDYREQGYPGLGAKMKQLGLGGVVDVVIDTVGGQMLEDILMNEGAVRDEVGKVVSIAQPLVAFGPEKAAEIGMRVDHRGISFSFFVVRPDGRHLDTLGSLVEARKLKGFIGGLFDLRDGRMAMEMVEQRGQVRRGKVVLRVNELSTQ